MSDITHILKAIDAGDTSAAQHLLPLVYDELRKLATQKMAEEKPGQTLQATALVHEAYLRSVGDQCWNGRRHFFAAAAEAMRRILVENARRKASVKRGGDRIREELSESQIAAPEVSDDLLALDEALTQLAATDASAAELVKLRYFAGLTSAQAADALGISSRTADRIWVYARSCPRAGHMVAGHDRPRGKGRDQCARPGDESAGALIERASLFRGSSSPLCLPARGTERFLGRCVSKFPWKERGDNAVASWGHESARARRAVWCRLGFAETGRRSLNHPGAEVRSILPRENESVASITTCKNKMQWSPWKERSSTF